MEEISMDLNRYRFYRKYGYFQTPSTLQVEITVRCPLNCPQCYKVYSGPGDMKLELFKKVIEEAECLGVKSITLNGGEPLMHPNFCEMVNLTIDSGIECGTIISGWGLDETILNALPKDKFHLFLSLNGSTEEVNGRSRDGYKYAIKAAALLNYRKFSYNINWVARHDNVKDLPDMIALSQKYGAGKINVVLNKLTGSMEMDSPLTWQDYDILKKVIETDPERFLVQDCYDQLFRILKFPQNPLYGCTAGIYNCAIDINGYFAPCTHLMYKEQHDNIRDYWQTSETLKVLRARRFMDDCKDCSIVKNCHFCRAQSKLTHDDLGKGLKDCYLKEYCMMRKEGENR